MIIDELTVGPIGTRCYVVSGVGSADCVVIDPGEEAARVRQALAGRNLAAILLTHGHFDHIAAAGELMTPATQLVIHALDAPMLTDPALNASRFFLGRDIIAPEATRTVREGDELDFAGVVFRVLHTPGHTPGSVCYQAGDIFFTGDTLFDNGWGRTDLPGGDEHQIMESLRRLIALTRGKVVYPGH